MPRNLDWVTETANCSLAECFERLRLQAKEDVDTRQSMRGDTPYFGFKFISDGRKFSVLLEGNNLYQAVTFTLESSAILVRDDSDREMFRATPTISDDGDCRLKVNNQELEFWQIRKRALEALFFAAH